VEFIMVFADHLEVKVSGVPMLNVLNEEVGLKVLEMVGVGDPTYQKCMHWLPGLSWSDPLDMPL
jgi:hypothetical protein